MGGEEVGERFAPQGRRGLGTGFPGLQWRRLRAQSPRTEG